MTRTRKVLTTLSLTGALALSACAATAPVDVAAEAYALRTVGLETGLAEATPAPSASAERRRGPLRRYLRQNTLHGEITVQGKQGVRTIVVQRGTVTAVDGRTVSVRSTDGFALTWTLGDSLRVVQDRKKADISAVKAGAEIGIAGAKEGTATTARLIVIK